ncbi:MAG: hypothetical protein UY39_C0004G0008 [Candidatus Kaiserbacteria bacterium GW2011_GWC2_49_12]|uniref:Uncharacterized protein n=2 Tax=Candidatus Kaiseribacteriota TaxID=1752734 RepID=A0A1F6FLN8_9BACT|nr:MAG: hypothetical protein UY39_C0004G0008 [Candidatus Kaiserbacteria bacterium GW2011_GWC2_49_12]OGG86778.1 MAG: hypothetical protein A3H15_01770 [Candidatus Kaiserbacteria bacterium RIFCSPLOWO2_12_FULL_50_28]
MRGKRGDSEAGNTKPGRANETRLQTRYIHAIYYLSFSTYYGGYGEANISAQETQAHADARLYETCGDTHRSRASYAPSQKRPHASIYIGMQRAIGITSAEFRQLRPVRRIQGRFFSLLVGALPSEHVRCACVVSKKAEARAVARNTVKRRCREALRGQYQNIKKPITLVFHAKASASGASYAEIAEDVRSLIMRATMP